MFEKEAEKYRATEKYVLRWDMEQTDLDCIVEETYQNGAVLGYNKAKEELTGRLDNATEIIELMKDLFFDCWQEKGYKAIQFEQRVNDFLKGD